MFERVRRFGRGTPDTTTAAQPGGTATAEADPATAGRGATAGRTGNGYDNGDRTAPARSGGAATATATPPAAAPATRRGPVRRSAEDALVVDEAARVRQRERFGGFNWGAGFFGWLVALGLGALLTAIVAAAGTAIGLTNKPSAGDAGTIGIVGAAILLAIGIVAYYAGGYVAGRMSRFDGGRQGFGAWLIGLVITLIIAAAGGIFGSQYNVLSGLHLPRIPVDEGSLTTGGAVFLAAFLVGTLLASIAGGTVGRRYHARVDRAAFDAPEAYRA